MTLTSPLAPPRPDDAACAVVELEELSVLRRGVALLDRVSWTVRPGERWVVLGANGAGKTTLLQCAAGLVRATRGRARLFGEPVDTQDPAEALSRVGWASATLAERLPRGQRVVDTVLTASYARLRRGQEDYDEVDEQRARDLLVQLGCRMLVERPYASLSEGERKRVQIARALMPDPELLLLDEPAAGLDLGAREALLRRLGRLAQDPFAPTCVLVTHHVEEVPAGFTHALLLRTGTVVAAGPLEQVLTAGTLSACFGLPLVVDAAGGRFSARAAFA